MAKTKTGTRRKRGVTAKQRGAARRESDTAMMDSGRPRGATRTARRGLSNPRSGSADEDGSTTRSRAATGRGSRPEAEIGEVDGDMREGDNPRAAFAEFGARATQPPVA